MEKENIPLYQTELYDQPSTMRTHDDENDDSAALISDEPGKFGMNRDVNFIGAISLLVGTMIGSGIFASPSSVAYYARSTGAILIIWIGCGVLSMMAAVCWCELGTMFPRACAEYSYIYEGFGEIPAFLFSFVSILVLKPAALVILLLTCGDYIMSATGYYNQVYSKVIAAFALGLLICVMYVSSKGIIKSAHKVRP